MAKIRNNFSESEFRCPCCGDVEMDDRLLDALQELRDLVGVPVHVTSGYRCQKHNQEIGGHPRSRHLSGEAADIHIKGMDVLRMFHAALRVHAFRRGGIGIYPDGKFIHVDVGRQVRWGRIGKSQVSLMRAMNHYWRTRKEGEKS